MGPALLLIAQLYRVEKQARPLTAEDRLGLRQLQSRPVWTSRMTLLEIQSEVLPKSSGGAGGTLYPKELDGADRYCDDGNLEIDNNGTERAIRSVAVGRNNWVFFGSDQGGKTGAVLRSFVASCQRVGIDPFTWLKDVLSRIAVHPITRLRRVAAAQLGTRWLDSLASNRMDVLLAVGSPWLFSDAYIFSPAPSSTLVVASAP